MKNLGQTWITLKIGDGIERIRRVISENFFRVWVLRVGLFAVDMGLKLKIVPDSWEYTGFWKFGPYWPQK
jgi:hypothetical protein